MFCCCSCQQMRREGESRELICRRMYIPLEIFKFADALPNTVPNLIMMWKFLVIRSDEELKHFWKTRSELVR